MSRKKKPMPHAPQTQTFFDFVSIHGERPAAKLLNLGYSMLRRANAGEIRPSPKVLDLCEAHGLDREATLIEWDRRHSEYIQGHSYELSVARNSRAQERRLALEASGPEGILGERNVVLCVTVSPPRGRKKTVYIESVSVVDNVPEGRAWCHVAERRKVYVARVPWPNERVRKGDTAALSQLVAGARLVATYEERRQGRGEEVVT